MIPVQTGKEKGKLFIAPCHQTEQNHLHSSRDRFIYMTSLRPESMLTVYLETVLSLDNLKTLVMFFKWKK